MHQLELNVLQRNLGCLQTPGHFVGCEAIPASPLVLQKYTEFQFLPLHSGVTGAWTVNILGFTQNTLINDENCEETMQLKPKRFTSYLEGKIA